jgi:nucleoid-associated protein YgaU
MKKTVFLLALAPALAFAQGKESFIVQQAYAEMQRVQGQISVLESNLNDLSARVAKLEGGNDSAGLRREVEALRAEVASLRRQLGSQRSEIVNDLSGRISKMQTAQAPAPRAAPKKPAAAGPCREYVVAPGDTLWVISEATGVPVSKIREMNGLKKDAVLRIGQKLALPK